MPSPVARALSRLVASVPGSVVLLMAMAVAVLGVAVFRRNLPLPGSAIVVEVVSIRQMPVVVLIADRVPADKARPAPMLTSPGAAALAEMEPSSLAAVMFCSLG